jgi:hypothetical protein
MNCVGCVNLRNKQYHIFNKPYSKEEYAKKLVDFDFGSFKKLQFFIYQPDRASYYVIDFRDSIRVIKVTRPIRIKRRAIAGELNGSFSEELNKQGVDAALANTLIKVYAWSIDFFKLKKD